MLKPLIRRQFLWTLLIFVIVLSGAHLLTRYVMSMDRVDMLGHQLAVYKYVLDRAPDKRVAVGEINGLNEKTARRSVFPWCPRIKTRIRASRTKNCSEGRCRPSCPSCLPLARRLSGESDWKARKI